MARIFVAGSRGMVGSAIVRALKERAEDELLLPGRNELDLKEQKAVSSFLEAEKVDQVFVAAAKVGGIHANNTYPAEFLYDNLMIQANLIDAAYRSGVERLVFLGSSCIYPKYAEQPIVEEALLTGSLEPTNEAYAIAKIAGIKLCDAYTRQYGCDFRSLMPTNLYGPGDNFHPENSHVIPALIDRFHRAKINQSKRVELWGTGSPLREFLHVDDLAEASLFVMGLSKADYSSVTSFTHPHLNVGYGTDCTIKELAHTLTEVIGYDGQLVFDTSKPDGTPRKLMDSSRIQSLGWRPTLDLKAGLEHAYAWYLDNLETLRA